MIFEFSVEEEKRGREVLSDGVFVDAEKRSEKFSPTVYSST